MLALLQAAILLTSACRTQPIDPAAPRPEPAYPVLLNEDENREEAALIAWRQFSEQLGLTKDAAIELHPVTATVLSINPATTLYLPLLGGEAKMTEEEIRESLRRFISEWQPLIGAAPAQLSLVDRLDLADGTKVAHYEQRPFRYPLRGDFGKFRIHFSPDRRVLQLSSTSIPEAERLQSTIAAITPQISREDAVARLRNDIVYYTDASGTLNSFTTSPNTEINIHTLVVYVRSAQPPDGPLEFRLAWEIELPNEPVRKLYMDSVTGQLWQGQISGKTAQMKRPLDLNPQ